MGREKNGAITDRQTEMGAVSRVSQSVSQAGKRAERRLDGVEMVSEKKIGAVDRQTDRQREGREAGEIQEVQQRRGERADSDTGVCLPG
mmetsp:Transcript_36689/g.91911  ORF Transcript_36689/g.91911 Transcript_36689/m.91911 type:complete len:89 (+) Transcript_36689:438-704(+)